jgi:GMP synthase-like glutamine amidotransferase
MLNGELCLGYCPEGNGHSIYPFNRIFKQTKNLKDGFEGVDVAIFWGGTDIHPTLYGEGRHPYSQASVAVSRRDLFEWKAMLYCKVHNIPMIGICRGAQLMCAFAGGTLVQHVTGHSGAGDHSVTTSEGEEFIVTSCHHQMMYPYNVEHQLLAWSSDNRSECYEGAYRIAMDCMKDKKEPEVVYFPAINGLAIQGHPEWAAPQSEYVDYCKKLVRSHLLTEVDAPF